MKALALVVLAGAGLSLLSGAPRGFTTPDKRGQACSDCHSPDGIELSAFDYSHADLMRRATPHLGPVAASFLADDIIQKRNRVFGNKVMDPMIDRPLQPGRYPLPGTTPAERDVAFLREIAQRLPSLFGRPIRTLAQAKSAQADLINLDLGNLKVGIVFNRLTEDIDHGLSHATIADWAPEIDLPGMAKIGPLLASYRSEPTVEHLRIIDKRVARLPVLNQLQAIDREKYRAMLLFQQALRSNPSEVPSLDHIHLLGDGNPFWNIADLARRSADQGPMDLGMTSQVKSEKSGGPSMVNQVKALRLPWFWAGWVVDPGLNHSGLLEETRRADYFCKALWSDGPYPNHMAFMLAERFAHLGAVPSNWRADVPSHYEIQFSFFVMGPQLAKLKLTPPQRAFYENVFRMALLLESHDLDQCRVAISPSSQINQVRLMRALFHQWGGGTADEKLCDRVSLRLSAATPVLR